MKKCQCAEGWQGYDCRTPVCKEKVTPSIQLQLMTDDERKIRIFEEDPCGMVGFSSLYDDGEFVLWFAISCRRGVTDYFVHYVVRV